MRPGQRQGFGADERGHHVEQQHERHEAGGGQQQHRGAGAGSRAQEPGGRAGSAITRVRSSRGCLGRWRGAGRSGEERRPEGKRRSRARVRRVGAALPGDWGRRIGVRDRPQLPRARRTPLGNTETQQPGERASGRAGRVPPSPPSRAWALCARLPRAGPATARPLLLLLLLLLLESGRLRKLGPCAPTLRTVPGEGPRKNLQSLQCFSASLAL